MCHKMKFDGVVTPASYLPWMGACCVFDAMAFIVRSLNTVALPAAPPVGAHCFSSYFSTRRVTRTRLTT